MLPLLFGNFLRLIQNIKIGSVLNFSDLQKLKNDNSWDTLYSFVVSGGHK